MVLDAKSGVGHNDYGSIGVAGGAPDEVSCRAGGGVDGTPAPVVMTQNDLYQRQPLLPSWPADKEEGNGGGEAVTSLYDDEEDKDDDEREGNGMKRSMANGGPVVAIDMPRPIRDEKFPKEKWKTFIAFLILSATAVFTTLSLSLVHDRVPDKDKYAPLPDIILDHIPTFPGALDASEIIIMISTNVTFLVISLHKHRFIVIRRACLILSVLYVMRSITMFVTVLPMSSTTYYCSPKSNSTSFAIIAKRVFQLISGFGLSINGKHTYCGDFIFSGHTVVLVLCNLIITEYSPKRLILLHWGSFIASMLGICLVLVARGHYTVDILIAYYATTRVFWMYHTLANHKKLKQSTADNMLSRMFWFRVFLYFEGNVGGTVPRLYNWPLPWPRRLLAKHPNRDS